MVLYLVIRSLSEKQLTCSAVAGRLSPTCYLTDCANGTVSATGGSPSPRPRGCRPREGGSLVRERMYRSLHCLPFLPLRLY